MELFKGFDHFCIRICQTNNAWLFTMELLKPIAPKGQMFWQYSFAKYLGNEP